MGEFHGCMIASHAGLTVCAPPGFHVHEAGRVYQAFLHIDVTEATPTMDILAGHLVCCQCLEKDDAPFSSYLPHGSAPVPPGPLADGSVSTVADAKPKHKCCPYYLPKSYACTYPLDSNPEPGTLRTELSADGLQRRGNLPGYTTEYPAIDTIHNPIDGCDCTACESVRNGYHPEFAPDPDRGNAADNRSDD